MTNKSQNTQFSAANQPTNKRGKAKRTMMLDALKNTEEALSEQEFYNLIAQRALRGDRECMSFVVDRVFPTEKSTYPTVEFELDPSLSLMDKCVMIIQATASGILPPDIGQLFVNMIHTSMDVFEKTVMAERVDAIETLLKGGVDG